jgi:hypothetical protein
MIHPADHPPTCEGCNGTGYQEGPPILSQAGGEPVVYSTVVPCTHHWSNDELPLEVGS